MIRLNRLLRKLEGLQTQLQVASNRLWIVETALNRLSKTADSGAFLPRRFRALRRESQARVNSLLEELSFLLKGNFSRGLLRISRPGEAPALFRIRTLLKSIQNAYVTDLPLRGDLESLRSHLPRN